MMRVTADPSMIYPQMRLSECFKSKNGGPSEIQNGRQNTFLYTK